MSRTTRSCASCCWPRAGWRNRGRCCFTRRCGSIPEELAGRTSRAFMGVRMECAQCHDHPFDDDISQHDFWSFAAFFARISRPRGKMEMTSPVLAGPRQSAGRRDDSRFGRSRAAAAAEDASRFGRRPDGPSRRRGIGRLAHLAPRIGDSRRRRSTACGPICSAAGIVEPVDDMRPANRAHLPGSARHVEPRFCRQRLRHAAAIAGDRADRCLPAFEPLATTATPPRTLRFRPNECQEFHRRTTLRLHRRGDAAGGAGRAAPPIEAGLARFGRHESASLHAPIPRSARPSDRLPGGHPAGAHADARRPDPQRDRPGNQRAS